MFCVISVAVSSPRNACLPHDGWHVLTPLDMWTRAWEDNTSGYYWVRPGAGPWHWPGIVISGCWTGSSSDIESIEETLSQAQRSISSLLGYVLVWLIPDAKLRHRCKITDLYTKTIIIKQDQIKIFVIFRWFLLDYTPDWSLDLSLSLTVWPVLHGLATTCGCLMLSRLDPAGPLAPLSGKIVQFSHGSPHLPPGPGSKLVIKI